MLIYDYNYISREINFMGSDGAWDAEPLGAEPRDPPSRSSQEIREIHGILMEDMVV